MTTSESLRCSSTTSTVISFVIEAIGSRSCGFDDGEHLAGPGVLDHVGAGLHGRHGRPAALAGRASAGNARAAATRRGGGEAPHLILIRSPMCRVVEETFGLSCSMVATGTPVRREMTLKVSPA